RTSPRCCEREKSGRKPLQVERPRALGDQGPGVGARWVPNSRPKLTVCGSSPGSPPMPVPRTGKRRLQPPLEPRSDTLYARLLGCMDGGVNREYTGGLLCSLGVAQAQRVDARNLSFRRGNRVISTARRGLRERPENQPATNPAFRIAACMVTPSSAGLGAM